MMPISTAVLSRFMVSSLLLSWAKLCLIILYINRWATVRANEGTYRCHYCGCSASRDFFLSHMARLTSLSQIRISVGKVSRCVDWLSHRISKRRAPIVSVSLFVVIHCAELVVVDIVSHSPCLVGSSSSEGSPCRGWGPERGVGDFSTPWCTTFSHTKSGRVTTHQSITWTLPHNLRLVEWIASGLP